MSDPVIDNYQMLWNILGRVVTVAMLPWMIWVSVTIVGMQKDIAVMRAQTSNLPVEVRGLRDRIILLESKLEGLETQEKG